MSKLGWILGLIFGAIIIILLEGFYQIRLGVIWKCLIPVAAAAISQVIFSSISEKRKEKKYYDSNEAIKEIKEESAKDNKKDDIINDREPSENEWKCPECGRINQNYVGTCGCGKRRS